MIIYVNFAYSNYLIENFFLVTQLISPSKFKNNNDNH